MDTLSPSDVDVQPEGGEVVSSGSPWRLVARTFTQNRLAVTGVIVVIALILFSFVGPLIYHTDQFNPNLAEVRLPPGSGHPLGTDQNGFDILGRLMEGGKSSLEVGLAVGFIATVFGLVYGAAALVLGALFFWLAVALRRETSHRRAVKLFHFSMLCLALLFVAMAFDAVV